MSDTKNVSLAVWRKPPARFLRGSAFGPAARLLARLLPGVLLCLAVTAASNVLAALEARLFGRVWLEALVVAILVGTAIRTAWTPDERWSAGIGFSAKTLLEVAVLLLGASLSAQAIMAGGPALPLGIAALVVAALGASYGMSRLAGLRHRMAVLVACGNSICGNSAIAAVAPVIGASGEDVAAAIAFTAVLGVGVVIGLPLLVPVLHLSQLQYGALAGLTVYAVPQVLAATVPVGVLAVQMGTLVKLMRVLMLGPVVVGLSLLVRRRRDGAQEARPRVAGDGAGVGAGPGDSAGDGPAARLPFHRMVPWFILGFVLLAGLRSADLLPQMVLTPLALTANLLTVVSMAALGLGTDLGSVARSGPRVMAAVTLSLLMLGAIGFGLIRLLWIG